MRSFQGKGKNYYVNVAAVSGTFVFSLVEVACYQTIKYNESSFVFKPPTHWEYQYTFALSTSNKENVIYLLFN